MAAAAAAVAADRHLNALDDDRACEDACVDDDDAVVPWQSRRPSWARSAYAAEDDLGAVDRAMDPCCAF